MVVHMQVLTGWFSYAESIQRERDSVGCKNVYPLHVRYIRTGSFGQIFKLQFPHKEDANMIYTVPRVKGNRSSPSNRTF